jgi:eukaryotic-like serine/threonine-protein kinase
LILAEGELVDDRYRIVHVISIGRTSTVVEVSHAKVGERLVLKILQPEPAADPVRVQLFYREARALSVMQNEHTCRILDFGQTNKQMLYAVLEYCDGLDLARYVEQRGRLALVEAIDYVVQASESIAEAHALGLAHGKLAAGKLIITTAADGRPFVKVLGIGGSVDPEPRAADFANLATILDDAAANRRPIGFADVLAMCRDGDFATVGQFADALAPFAAS